MTLAEAAAALDRLLAGQSKEFHAASISSSKRTPYLPPTCWSASASVPVSPPSPPHPSNSRASFLEYTQPLEEFSPSSRTEVDKHGTPKDESQQHAPPNLPLHDSSLPPPHPELPHHSTPSLPSPTLSSYNASHSAPPPPFTPASHSSLLTLVSHSASLPAPPSDSDPPTSLSSFPLPASHTDIPGSLPSAHACHSVPTYSPASSCPLPVTYSVTPSFHPTPVSLPPLASHYTHPKSSVPPSLSTLAYHSISSSSSHSALKCTSLPAPPILALKASQITPPSPSLPCFTACSTQIQHGVRCCRGEVGWGQVTSLDTPDPTKFKTELCRSFQVHGYCRYGTRCNYAHGLHQLRGATHHGKYKTRNCKSYHETGCCRYGARCSFIHDPEEGVLKCSIANKEVLEALHYSPGNEDEYRTAKITWRLVGASSSPPPELHFLTSNKWCGQHGDVGSDCEPQECQHKSDLISSLPAVRSVSSAASKEQEGLYKTSASLLRSGKKNVSKTETPTSPLKRKHSASEFDFISPQSPLRPQTPVSNAKFPLHSEGSLSVPAPRGGGKRGGVGVGLYNAKELLDLEVVQSILKGGRRYSTTQWSPADDEMDAARCHLSFSGGELLKPRYSEITNFRFEANYVSRRGSSCKREYLPRQHQRDDTWVSEVKPLFVERPVLCSTLQSDSDSEASGGGGDGGCSGWQQLSGLVQEQSHTAETWPERGRVGRQCGSTRHCHDLSKYKTELCRSYQYSSHCGYGDACLYAHGTLDLRSCPRHPMYRTKQCFSFHYKGYCLYGSRCQFAHDID